MYRHLFLILLILCLASVVHAGLDSYDCFCELVIAFRFESTQFN